MKKKIIILIIIVLIILLIPVPIRIKDGGSVEFKAAIYKYTKIHRFSEKSLTGYENGWELEILGKRVGGVINTYVEAIEKDSNLTLAIKSNTLTNKGATFILKNNTDVDYAYDDYYIIERFDKKENWVDLDLIIGWTPRIEPQVYTIKSKEEHEIYIEWSNIYGKLNSGTYRIVKNNFRKANRPDSRTYSVYTEFSID
ncbi:MAG: hypothetical protein IKR74_03740 [Bacilli bacterium]|nr:hypothetical protein [Bacilli bacterium]